MSLGALGWTAIAIAGAAVVLLRKPGGTAAAGTPQTSAPSSPSDTRQGDTSAGAYSSAPADVSTRMAVSGESPAHSIGGVRPAIRRPPAQVRTAAAPRIGTARPRRDADASLTLSSGTPGSPLTRGIAPAAPPPRALPGSDNFRRTSERIGDGAPRTQPARFKR